MTIRKRYLSVVYNEILLIIWQVNAAYELALVNDFLIVSIYDVFNHFIQLKILSRMLEKTSLASYYNLTLPI